MTEAAAGAWGNVEIRQAGSERCAAGHQYGPAVRDHFLIHFIAEGRGVFEAEGRTHALSAGQGFLILPEQVTTYRADALAPWTYGWVGYAGRDARALTAQIGLTRERPVFTLPDAASAFALLRGISDDARRLRLGRLAALGGLYRFLALIGESLPAAPRDIAREYVDKALWYMEGGIPRTLRVTDVAAFVGLSRSQLFRAFRRAEGRSPQQCLDDIRLRRAKQLMAAGALSMSEIAASVGLLSPDRLAELFRRREGVSAARWRNQHGA